MVRPHPTRRALFCVACSLLVSASMPSVVQGQADGLTPPASPADPTPAPGDEGPGAQEPDSGDAPDGDVDPASDPNAASPGPATADTADGADAADPEPDPRVGTDPAGGVTPGGPAGEPAVPAPPAPAPGPTPEPPLDRGAEASPDSADVTQPADVAAAEVASEGEAGNDEDPTSGIGAADRAMSISPTAGGLRWSLPLVFDQSINVRGLNPGSQLTYYPIYTWLLSARPRWNISDRMSVGLRQDFLLEMTRSQFTSQHRRLWAEDTRLDLAYTMKPRPGGFIFTWRALLRLPVSPLSRGARRFFNVGPGLLVMRPVDVLGGLVFSASASYRVWASGSNVPLARRRDEGFPCVRAGEGASVACEQIGTVSAIRDITTLSIGANLIPVDHLSISLGFAWLGLRGSRLADACFTTLTDDETCLSDGSETHLRSLTSFSLSVGYDIRPYFTLRLNYATLASHPDSDGGRENPIYNELTTISLTSVFRVGGFVAARRAERTQQEP